MERSTPNLYRVYLADDQRERLEQITRNGNAPAKKIQHARVLLLSDHNRPDGAWTRDRIGEALQMHVNTVDRIRKKFVREGEQPAINRKPRELPPTPPKLDGRAEAYLVAICCGPAPEGRTRWTLKLLADELVHRRVVTQVSAETVRKTLKKTSCSLGVSSAGASPNATPPGSWRRWKTCWTSTPSRPTTRAR